MRPFLIFLLLAIFLSACNGSQSIQTHNPADLNEPSYPNVPSYPNEPAAGQPNNQSFAPRNGDDALTHGDVFLDSTEILVMESDPVQIMLVLKGSLPTPCNQLRVADNPPDNQNHIQVKVYSVLDPEQICAQVLDPFEANIALGSFPSGHYSVWINGEMIGEFDS